MKKHNAKLTNEQWARLEALEDLPDNEIDFSDIPETFDWSNGIRGAFCHPAKREITLELDEYVIDWFRDNAPEGRDCQENINQALLEHIRRQRFPPRRQGNRQPEPGRST